MLTNNLECLMSFRLPAIWLLLLWVELPGVAIDVIEDGVLDASEVKPAVKHCSAIVFVSLPEAWVLM